MKTLQQITQELENTKTRSKWAEGVKNYAFELLEKLKEAEENGAQITPENITKIMLNGAQSWHQYSWGGCSYIYNGDIAAALCTPSELKKTHNGERRPNTREDWLDVQARALYQAARLIKQIYTQI